MPLMSTSAITSDAITWNAPDDDHPARVASQRSYSAVAKGDLAEWLTVYAEDAVLEDPVGPSMFDPRGAGPPRPRGHLGVLGAGDRADRDVRVRDQRLVRQPGQQHLRQHRPDPDVVPRRQHTTTDLIMVYVVNDDGRVASMKAYWEPDRTMASFTTA